jgi:cholesterol oxidase
MLGAAKILNYLMVILITKVAQNWVWKINLMLLMLPFILEKKMSLKKIPTFDGLGPERTGNFCGACMTGCRNNSKNTLDKIIYTSATLWSSNTSRTRSI